MLKQFNAQLHKDFLNYPKNFASSLNFYQCFWLFFIGSFLGVIIEMIWCLIRNGYVESRTGLIWGLFNPVYGFGTLALTLGLYWLSGKGDGFIFIGGMVIGSLVEFTCSYVQEKMLGSTSWDYSELPFNLGGRVSLMYAVFWGILAVAWIKTLYPLMMRIITHLPDTHGKLITWVLLAFMLGNCAFSAAAVLRWNDRLRATPQTFSHAIDNYFDTCFPNEKLVKYYPDMEHPIE